MFLFSNQSISAKFQLYSLNLCTQCQLYGRLKWEPVLDSSLWICWTKWKGVECRVLLMGNILNTHVGEDNTKSITTLCSQNEI